MTQAPSEPRYLTVREFAKLVGLHEVTIYRKIKKGEIAYMRMGRTLRVLADQVASQKTGTSPS